MQNDAKHRSYTVGELARLPGVSIRTLHHYDASGLLKPAWVGGNRYREYGREELLRLQQIFFHRELGMSLADIAAVLDAPSFDRLTALRRQREQVLTQANRHRRLLATIDRTIAELEGQRPMQDRDLYKGFAPEKQAEYEAYIIERYGDDGRRQIEAGRKRIAEMSAVEIQEHMNELATVEAELAAALKAGIASDDPLLDPVLARHHAWVGAGCAVAPSAEAYSNLGVLYANHPDFVSRYRALQPGLARWLHEAMVAFAQRKLA